MAVTLPPFQQFLDRHSENVYRFLRASVGPTEADDCFQETFLAALRAYPRLRPDSNLRAWILTIAHRKALDSHRAARRERPVADLPDAASEPQLAEDELWSLVSELPDKQRIAVAHRYVNDLPYADIAEIMGTSVEAARRSVHEGLKTLRGAIA